MDTKDKMLKNIPELKTKLDVLTDQYNKAITDVTIYETEVEFLRYLEMTEPAITTHITTRQKGEAALKERLKMLDIIRNRILNIDKEANGKTN